MCSSRMIEWDGWDEMEDREVALLTWLRWGEKKVEKTPPSPFPCPSTPPITFPLPFRKPLPPPSPPPSPLLVPFPLPSPLPFPPPSLLSSYPALSFFDWNRMRGLWRGDWAVVCWGESELNGWMNEGGMGG